jgi:DNA-binding response OmpR family regulator
MDLRKLKQKVVIIGDGFGEMHLELTQCEWRLFHTLVKQPDTYVPYTELCQSVLGFVPVKHSFTIRQHAKTLRKRLAAAGIDAVVAIPTSREDLRPTDTIGSYRFSVPLDRQVRACESRAAVA